MSDIYKIKQLQTLKLGLENKINEINEELDYLISNSELSSKELNDELEGTACGTEFSINHNKIDLNKNKERVQIDNTCTTGNSISK